MLFYFPPQSQGVLDVYVRDPHTDSLRECSWPHSNEARVSIYDTKAVFLDFRLPASRAMDKISLLLVSPPDVGILTQQCEQTRQ